MRQANPAAQFFYTQAIRVHDELHRAALRTGQTATRELSLHRLPQNLPYVAKVKVDFLSERYEFALAHG